MQRLFHQPELHDALGSRLGHVDRPIFPKSEIVNGIEHRIARLGQLGIRQARYVGTAKTLFQLAMAAAVANLTLLANRTAEGATSLGSVGASGLLALLGALMCRITAPTPALQRIIGPLTNWAEAQHLWSTVTTRTITTTGCRPDF